jgi:anaerobic selenocysteine-containing dehydrogenase
MKGEETIKVFRTVASSAGPGCHGGCGQKLYVQDGKVIRLEGDENHPWNQGRSCPRVLAMTQYMYHPDRITTPLKRTGAWGGDVFLTTLPLIPLSEFPKPAQGVIDNMELCLPYQR